MQRTTLYILITGFAVCIISCLYFLLLALGISSMLLTIILPLAAVGGMVLFFIREKTALLSEQSSFRMAITAFLLLNMMMRVDAITEKYGGWDAWAIWNLHARYLANPDHWQQLFLNVKYGHPDYPMLLPATIAYFSRVIGAGPELPAFILGIFFTFAIPVLLFMQQAQKSIIIATVVALVPAMDTFFLHQGVSMYADVPLAFFFLCAVIAVSLPVAYRLRFLLAGAALGCCIWTKNEGMILAGIFFLYHVRGITKERGLLWLFMGAVMPILTLLILKVGFAPANDLVQGIGTHTLAQITDTHRYVIVYNHFSDIMSEKLSYMMSGMLICGILYLWRKTMPGKNIMMIWTCVIAYFMVYIISPQGLEWHLATSADRLLLQLMPAAMFIIAEEVSDIGPFSFFRFNIAGR